MEKIIFELSLKEANAILQALGNLPYAEVAPLVHKIKQQAEAQLQTVVQSAVEKNEPPATEGGEAADSKGTAKKTAEKPLSDAVKS